MSLSYRQLQIIHQAKRFVMSRDGAFDDAAYRTVLRSIAGVESSKDLGNQSFEQVMAWFESVGYQQPGSQPGYWTAKSQRYSRHQVTDREIRMIEQLAAEQSYDLAGLIGRLTNHRTTNIQQLSSQEAFKLIEALKAIVVSRPQRRAGAADPPGQRRSILRAP